MLSSSMLREEVDSIVELVAQGHTDDARQKLNQLLPQVSSEYGRGAALALNGILNVLENKSPDKMADREKVLRVTDRTPKAQILDDLDRGYLQTMSKWSKRTKETPKETGESVVTDPTNPSQE